MFPNTAPVARSTLKTEEPAQSGGGIGMEYDEGSTGLPNDTTLCAILTNRTRGDVKFPLSLLVVEHARTLLTMTVSREHLSAA